MNTLHLAIFSASLGLANGMSFFGVHTCDEGHVCVYTRGNAVLDSIRGPGYHWKLPLVTDHTNVQVTSQTDRLRNVECGSSKGGTVNLDIEIVNRLRDSPHCVLETVKRFTFDYDHRLLYQPAPAYVAEFCKTYTLEDIVVTQFDKLDDVLLDRLREHVSEFAPKDPIDNQPCVEISKVYIRRPKLAPNMRAAFEAIELEQKQKDLESQKQQTEKIKLETQLQKEVMEKEREQRMAEITLQTKTMEAQSEATRQAIVDNKEADTIRKAADAERYRLEELAKGNLALYDNENYVRVRGFEAAHNNAKLILGDAPQNALSLLNLNSGDSSVSTPPSTC